MEEGAAESSASNTNMQNINFNYTVEHIINDSDIIKTDTI